MSDEFKEKRKEAIVWCFKVLYYSTVRLDRGGGAMKILSGIVGVWAKIRTGNLHNTS